MIFILSILLLAIGVLLLVLILRMQRCRIIQAIKTGRRGNGPDPPKALERLGKAPEPHPYRGCMDG
jgi:hypothetical protein